MKKYPKEWIEKFCHAIGEVSNGDWTENEALEYLEGEEIVKTPPKPREFWIINMVSGTRHIKDKPIVAGDTIEISSGYDYVKDVIRVCEVLDDEN